MVMLAGLARRTTRQSRKHHYQILTPASVLECAVGGDEARWAAAVRVLDVSSTALLHAARACRRQASRQRSAASAAQNARPLDQRTSTRVARTQPPAAVVRAVTPPVRQAIRVVEDETLRDLEPVPCHKRHIARRVWVRRRLHHVGRARGIDLVPVPALRQAVRRVRACAYIIYNHGSAEELMR